MNKLIEKVDRFATTHKLINQEAAIVVGLSGGPDSVFLLHTLASLQKPYQLTLVAAHLDHAWRAESQQDVDFCTKFCEKLNIQLVAKRLTSEDYGTLPQNKKGSHEEQGRYFRRRFFEEVAQEHNSTCIALAHHRDDNSETFFIRLMRGTSLTGLTGIKPRDGIYIHPLLCCTKEEILSYLATNQIPFLHDRTNDTDLFLRNKIRRHAIPALEKCDKRFHQSLETSMAQLQEAEAFLEHHATNLFASLSRPKKPGSPCELHIDQLLNQPVVIQKRILLRWLVQEQVSFVPSQALFDEIIRFLRQKKSVRHLLYHSFYIVKSKGYVKLEQKA